jgi:hypothetical protein
MIQNFSINFLDGFCRVLELTRLIWLMHVQRQMRIKISLFFAWNDSYQYDKDTCNLDNYLLYAMLLGDQALCQLS